MINKVMLFLKLSLGIKPTISAFRSLVRTLAIRKWHRLYEFSLKKMDPSLDLSHTEKAAEKTFIFQGRGNGTLKPYRMISMEKGRVFEKIFINSSENLKANLDFYLNSQEYLKDTNIQIPKCLKVSYGKLFTAVLYEYLELKPLPIGQKYQILKEKTLMLYNTSNGRTYADPLTYDKYLFGRMRLVEEQHFSSSDLNEINLLIARAPVYFQHLDLGENNVYENDIIIDWDNSGYFPLGMDFGKLVLNLFITQPEDFYPTYENEMNGLYQHLHHDISATDFKTLTLYFAIVFYYGSAKGIEHTRKIRPLIGKLKDLLRNNPIDTEIPVSCSM